MLFCFTTIAVCAWKGHHLLHRMADEDLSAGLMPFYLITFTIPENVTQPPTAVVRTGF